MNLVRFLRHLMTTRRQASRAFPRSTLEAIESAITASETGHAGQIRFVVEDALDGAPLFSDQSARERALDVFSQLRIWDTEHNNGVLIYLLLADRDVEIIADRGIHARVGAGQWEAICRGMEAAFKQGRYTEGVLDGLQQVTQHLKRHYPSAGSAHNELPDAPVIM